MVRTITIVLMTILFIIILIFIVVIIITIIFSFKLNLIKMFIVSTLFHKNYVGILIVFSKHYSLNPISFY